MFSEKRLTQIKRSHFLCRHDDKGDVEASPREAAHRQIIHRELVGGGSSTGHLTSTWQVGTMSLCANLLFPATKIYIYIYIVSWQRETHSLSAQEGPNFTIIDRITWSTQSQITWILVFRLPTYIPSQRCIFNWRSFCVSLFSPFPSLNSPDVTWYIIRGKE